MENKFLYILPILIATILVTTSLGSAELTTMTVPVTAGNYSTTLNVAITAVANGVYNMTNVTCRYNATGGSAELGTVLTQMLNDSNSDLSFTDAVDISSFSDLRTYNISCKVRNATTLNMTLFASGVTFDKTAPVITFDVKQKSINPNGLIEAKCSYTDATSGTTSASYFQYINPASTTNTLTADGTYQAISNEKTSQEGNYVFSCYAIDYSGNAATIQTATTTNTGFTINLTNQQTGGTGNSRLIIFIIIGVLIYLAVTSKKK